MTLDTVALDGGITRVNLNGRLDIAGAAAIDLRFSALASGERPLIVVDLSNAALLRARLTGCLEKKRLRDETRRHREQMEHDLRAARELQLGMLPADIAEPTPARPVTVHARMEPARELGGDLCDVFFPDPDTLFFAVGDVSGKGAAAALFMARTHSVLRAGAARETSGPAAILAAANRALSVDNHAMMFTTLVLGLLHLPTGAVRLAAAGHDPPYILRGHGIARACLPRRSLPLGVDPDAVYRETAFALADGEGVLAYTDGVTEAEATTGEQFGESRLEALLEEVRARDGAEVTTAAMDAVATFRGAAEPTDDLTLLVLRWTPGAGGPRAPQRPPPISS